MTTPDYRALCAELADELDEWIEGYLINDPADEHTAAAQAMVDRARTLLAAPEVVGVTDEELFNVMSARGERGANSKMLWLQEDDFVPTARAVLARYGTAQPAPVPVGERLPGEVVE